MSQNKSRLCFAPPPSPPPTPQMQLATPALEQLDNHCREQKTYVISSKNRNKKTSQAFVRSYKVCFASKLFYAAFKLYSAFKQTKRDKTVVFIGDFWVSFMPFLCNGVYYRPSKSNLSIEHPKGHFLTLNTLFLHILQIHRQSPVNNQPAKPQSR